jgi:hypothetical protein
MGDIHNVAAGKASLRHKMVVEFPHLRGGKELSPDAPLIGHDEAGDCVAVKQAQRIRRARHPGKIIDQMRVAMIDIQRLVPIKKYRAAPRRRPDIRIFR